MFLSVMVVKGDLKFVSESIDNASADTKAGEGARSGHKSNTGDIMEGFIVFG